MAAKPKFLLLENYLAVAKASVDSNVFRKLYYKIGNRKIEVLNDGDLSCAAFVSFILKIFSLIPEIHTTVRETEKDLRRAGWFTVRKPRPGAIIVYGPKITSSGETHKHLGIYLGGGKAISNRDFKKSPKIDTWDYRSVEKILWHKKLE
jgi:hypothetical protein